MCTPSLILTRRGLAFEISERGLPIAKLGWLCVLDYRVDSSVNWWCTMWTHSLILTRGGLAFEISERGPSTSLLLALWGFELLDYLLFGSSSIINHFTIYLRTLLQQNLFQVLPIFFYKKIFTNFFLSLQIYNFIFFY